MAIRFGFNKGNALPQGWLISLALVNSRFFKACKLTLSNFAIPSLIIYDNIRVASKYCLFKKPPLHLRSDEIRCVPYRKRPLCAERLESLTVPFSIFEYLHVTGTLPNLKTINFEEVEIIPRFRKWLDKRDDISVEHVIIPIYMLDPRVIYPIVFRRLLRSHIKDRHGLQSITFTTRTLDNPFGDMKDLLQQDQSATTINLRCYVSNLTKYDTTTTFDSLSHITSINEGLIAIPWLHKMTNLTSLHLQSDQSGQDQGMIDQLQQFYFGTHSLNTLELNISSANVIRLLPRCKTTPITSLTLAFTDIDRLAVLHVKGNLHSLFGTIATHLQQTMIKQLEYLTIYMKPNNIPFSKHCLSALTAPLQLHCINDNQPINFYRLVNV
ncbi:hypothetical protein SAMD00019534_116720 [Acytostelium subglobosum LB1]|uniref:hypothetical protein n=1 Tax=Acytostelium subglobosum LB1 TaxID=1410327 RepID=UPI000644AE76|nr:hypothetical protein SAMD00019534_116720 [Acytostelium subglobosum LB1]GAM28496.1 hypothetical protein SAMD00019534_116720 [Acytostelium subglobosum LB1]|eukprot:XP_012748535.1 hypothetical protein SAMD00019534_116720 [Acytostelium subglobosum LB1]